MNQYDNASKFTEKNEINCILTGFDAFGNLESNPTQELVSIFPSTVLTENAKVQIIPAILPTCCTDSWKKLRKILAHEKQKKKKTILLMTGIAQTRKHIELERIALNYQDYRIFDNKGHKPEQRKIIKNKPNAYISELPLADWCSSLEKIGHEINVSNHAGTFVCNELYYRSCLYQEQNNFPFLTLFVHIPLPENLAIDKLNNSITDTEIQPEERLSEPYEKGLLQAKTSLKELIKLMSIYMLERI